VKVDVVMSEEPSPATGTLFAQVCSEATLFDAYANMTSIVLEGLKINTSLPDSLFVFTPPPGVEIIKATQPIGR